MIKIPICGIYKITSPSGRIYVGQSVDIQKRKKKYKSLGCKGQSLLYNSIVKYGWESHSFDIIKKCDKKELNKWEEHYIKTYKSFNTKQGLNLRSGGSSNNVSEETKEKLRKYWTGKKKSPHVINILRKACIGRIPWNKGIPVTEEVKINLRKINTGKRHSKITKEKISEKQKGRTASWKNKPVIKCGLDGKTIKEYLSIREAAFDLGINEWNISHALKNFNKNTGGGFKWSYKK